MTESLIHFQDCFCSDTLPQNKVGVVDFTKARGGVVKFQSPQALRALGL